MRLVSGAALNGATQRKAAELSAQEVANQKVLDGLHTSFSAREQRLQIDIKRLEDELLNLSDVAAIRGVETSRLTDLQQNTAATKERHAAQLTKLEALFESASRQLARESEAALEASKRGLEAELIEELRSQASVQAAARDLHIERLKQIVDGNKAAQSENRRLRALQQELTRQNELQREGATMHVERNAERHNRLRVAQQTNRDMQRALGDALHLVDDTNTALILYDKEIVQKQSVQLSDLQDQLAAAQKRRDDAKHDAAALLKQHQNVQSILLREIQLCNDRMGTTMPASANSVVDVSINFAEQKLSERLEVACNNAALRAQLLRLFYSAITGTFSVVDSGGRRGSTSWLSDLSIAIRSPFYQLCDDNYVQLVVKSQ